jgi:predicted RNA-binding Zn ribbon-like protein
MDTVEDGYRFEISGGHAALDFANTINRRESPDESEERLTDYGRLISFSVQTGLVTASGGERLRAEAARNPRAAAAALRRAVTLREAIFRVFAAVACGAKPPSLALDAVNAALPRALSALRIESQRGGFGWRFDHDDGDLAPMLAPIVRAAAELLTSGECARVRECGSDTCYWLFLDRSKNGTRRWCNMKICGNRQKARRHYHRVKSAARS